MRDGVLSRHATLPVSPSNAEEFDVLLQHRAPADDGRKNAMPANVTKMPMPNLASRFFFRLIREIKSLFGVESYLRNEDRRVLEQVIFPSFLEADRYGDILFVGCHWYTQGYNKRFEERKKNYWTIEIRPAMRKYGAKQHIVDAMQNIGKHFKPDSLDLILCNGVFGWGLDARPDV